MKKRAKRRLTMRRRHEQKQLRKFWKPWRERIKAKKAMQVAGKEPTQGKVQRLIEAFFGS